MRGDESHLPRAHLSRGRAVEVDLQRFFAFGAAKLLQARDQLHLIVHRAQAEAEFGNQVVTVNQGGHIPYCTLSISPISVNHRFHRHCEEGALPDEAISAPQAGIASHTCPGGRCQGRCAKVFKLREVSSFASSHLRGEERVTLSRLRW